MRRISFRQGMLAGFLLIVILLGGVAVHGWLLLERLVGQSRDNSTQALQLTAAVQTLAERSIDIERSARQFLVLDDPQLRVRFDEHLAQSLALLARIDVPEAASLGEALAGWRGVATELRSALDRKSGTDELAGMLDRLASLNDTIRLASQRWIEHENDRLLGELERRRAQLGSRLALALLGAVLAALAMGWWLVRPVRQLEDAIGRLGASRFDQPVTVGGPDDLRRLGRRLDWLRQHLAELEADRERTLRHVSHELKTPLTALKEGVALLAEEVPGPLSASQREVVDILAHNVGGLQGQIESLLSLNAAAFEARHLNIARVEPARLLEEAAQRHELPAQARQLQIHRRAGEGAAELDAGKMAVILDNLLANAIDFSPSGGRIELRASRNQRGWRFECSDQGPGVAPEDVQRIFEPFVQGRQRAPVARRGSGVGLSIVRELVRAMGGSVALVPCARGACFQVDIPDER